MSSFLQHLHDHEPTEPAESADRPSIYELLATDELRELVQPAFRYVLAVSPPTSTSNLKTTLPEAKGSESLVWWWGVVLCTTIPEVLVEAGQPA